MRVFVDANVLVSTAPRTPRYLAQPLPPHLNTGRSSAFSPTLRSSMSRLQKKLDGFDVKIIYAKPAGYTLTAP
ncbi:MAG: hypothetical protein LBJ44_08800 [Propionibacteriaceae bacterium]|nr:hypothetical protein [Propionibacteriaceae bacterium]